MHQSHFRVGMMFGCIAGYTVHVKTWSIGSTHNSFKILFFVFFQPKLLSRELLDLVSSHFNLKEKEYFGLSFIDDT